ncbi:MAG: D-glycero-beta-D-manno-heptose 1,7-bisphosphate 7-phosphatase [Chromatiales bacterium]|nr:D-glycero-beta-D-manno-heptose 1,7-bisphosphate 7-phosphatase [Chromatiales bacterium]
MKLILLDRDGVINHDSPDYVKTPDEWLPIEGSIEAIAQLYKAGWRIFVVSNQSVIGRQLATVEALAKIHEKMQKLLISNGGQIDGLFFCPHHPDDDCRCRKPKTGLFEDLAKRMNISLKKVPYVGDTMNDLKAAKKIGAQAILVRSGQGATTEANSKLPKSVLVFDNLADVANHLRKQS